MYGGCVEWDIVWLITQNATDVFGIVGESG